MSSKEKFKFFVDERDGEIVCSNCAHEECRPITKKDIKHPYIICQDCEENCVFFNENLLPGYGLNNKKVIDLALSLAKVGENELNYLAGEKIDVDTLQFGLILAGYKKGSLGEKDIWYKNIKSDASGYIAKLEAVSPSNIKVEFIVETIMEQPMITKVS